MKDEQKQTEEMALSLQDLEYTLPDDEDTRYRYFTRLDKQSAKEIAKALISAGYRKQSDTAREIMLLLGRGFDEVTAKDFKDLSWYKSFCRELKRRYGVEVE